MKRKLTYSTRSREMVLDMLQRYGLTTTAVTHAVVCPGNKANAARKVLASMQKRDLITAHYEEDRTCYYTVPGVEFGTQGFIERAVVAFFCLLYSTNRKRFSKRELENQFPWLSPIAGAAWCQEADEGLLKLLAVKVDHGGSPTAFITKVVDFKSTHAARAQFQDLLAAGRFELVFLTATKQRAERLAKEVNRCLRLKDFPIRIQPIVELARFQGLTHK